MNQTVSPRSDLDNQLRQARLRTSRYWFEDGLVELSVGGLFVLIGLYFVAMGLLPGEGAVPAVLGGILFPLLFIGGILATSRLIRKAKEGLVYPRTGYVAYAKPSGLRRWLTAILGAVVSVLIVALVKRAPTIVSWTPALEGLLGGGILFWMGHASGVGRLSLVASVSVILGLALSLAGASGSTSSAVLYGAIGLLMAGGGAIAFRRYLRQAPPRAEGA
jgi:hypothetical protein